MLRLPLGLSIFIPAVRFDRSDADWPWDPRKCADRGEEQKLAAAGSERDATAFQRQAHNSILVYPIFSSCGCFLYLLYPPKPIQDSFRGISRYFPFPYVDLPADFPGVARLDLSHPLAELHYLLLGSLRSNPFLPSSPELFLKNCSDHQ